jgi:hypothetical protein
MHSNFVTPPDLIESILIIDASQEQIEACAVQCENAEIPYNVYFYNADMKDYDWLTQVVERVDTTLLQENSEVPVLSYVRFGNNQILKNPADYFAK